MRRAGGCGDLTEHRNMLDISGFLVRCRKLVHLRGAGRVDPADDEAWSSESRGQAAGPRLRFQEADTTVKSSQPRDACAYLDIQAWYWVLAPVVREGTVDGGRFKTQACTAAGHNPKSVGGLTQPRTGGPAWHMRGREIEMLQRMTAYPGQAPPAQRYAGGIVDLVSLFEGLVESISVLMKSCQVRCVS